jgi:environmental stress-induced protein Ves
MQMRNFNINLNITKPDEFTLVPWKNGLGHTTELAINEGGNLDHFDWRLSIASVITNGEFSNFSGYQRNLVLIEGNGLTLDHQNGESDKLTTLLDIASFDGSYRTLGSLNEGSIKDLVLII